MSTLERRRVQKPQVLLACLGNPLDHPAGHALGFDAADRGNTGGAAERLDDGGSLRIRGVGSWSHGPIVGISQSRARGNCERPTDGNAGTPQSACLKLSRMNTGTFQERLALAMDGLGRGAKSEMARAVGISPTSVNDWTSGKTKMPTADLIFPAARFLNVNPEWLATGKGAVRPSIGDGRVTPKDSQPVGLDAPTLGKAMRFARAWLTITGDSQPLEKHPHLVLTAAQVIETLEANIESEDELTQVMAKLAAMGGADGIKRGTTG